MYYYRYPPGVARDSEYLTPQFFLSNCNHTDETQIWLILRIQNGITYPCRCPWGWEHLWASKELIISRIISLISLKQLGQGRSTLELVSDSNLSQGFVSNPSNSILPYPLTFGPKRHFGRHFHFSLKGSEGCVMPAALWVNYPKTRIRNVRVLKTRVFWPKWLLNGAKDAIAAQKNVLLKIQFQVFCGV